MDITLNGKPVKLVVQRYKNKRMRIEARNADNSTFAVLTSNAPLERLEPGEIILKGWADNTGMIQQLVDQHVIYPPHRQISQGFVIMQVCHLKAIIK